MSRPTFYRWYDRYVQRGEAGLEDRKPHPGRIRNRIPDSVREKVKDLAPQESELSPRELAVRFTDTEKHFVSEASVYRILKSHDLITSPAFVVMKAADEFHDKTTAPNQLWQTGFTCLSTVLDDYSRYFSTRKLRTGMAASDVQDTLSRVLEEAGLDQANVVHRPRLLSDNGPCYICRGSG